MLAVELWPEDAALYRFSFARFSSRFIGAERDALQSGFEESSQANRRVPHGHLPLGVSAASVARLTEGLDRDAVEQIIARADYPAEAIAELDVLRVPDMAKVSVERGSTYDANAPFAILD